MLAAADQLFHRSPAGARKEIRKNSGGILKEFGGIRRSEKGIRIFWHSKTLVFMAWVFGNAWWEFPLYNIKGKQRLRAGRIRKSHASRTLQAACGLPAEILEFYANLLEACASPRTDAHACTYAAVHTPTYLLRQHVHRAKHLTWVHARRARAREKEQGEGTIKWSGIKRGKGRGSG